MFKKKLLNFISRSSKSLFVITLLSLFSFIFLTLLLFSLERPRKVSFCLVDVNAQLLHSLACLLHLSLVLVMTEDGFVADHGASDEDGRAEEDPAEGKASGALAVQLVSVVVVRGAEHESLVLHVRRSHSKEESSQNQGASH